MNSAYDEIRENNIDWNEAMNKLSKCYSGEEPYLMKRLRELNIKRNEILTRVN